MSNLKTKGTPQKKIAKKTIWLEKLAKDNLEIMHPAIEIHPMELAGNSNFPNYFYKFGTYPFIMNKTKCKYLHNISEKGFSKGLERYPDDEEHLYHALIINDKIYPGYDSYGIHARTDGIILAKKF